MAFAIKKPHPVHSKVKVWHTWDPDGDGYEEIRKFLTKEKAEKWVQENYPNKGCEIVDIQLEAGQTEEELAEKENLADDPTTPNGVKSYRNRDNNNLVGKLTSFTIDNELD